MRDGVEGLIAQFSLPWGGITEVCSMLSPEFPAITHSMDMNLSKLQEIVGYRGTWHVTVHGVAKSWTQLTD